MVIKIHRESLTIGSGFFFNILESKIVGPGYFKNSKELIKNQWFTGQLLLLFIYFQNLENYSYIL